MRLEDIIIPKNLKNTLSYGVERAGMTTEDKVYLYSAEEVMKSSNRARAIIPTDYAILNNAMVNFDYGYSMLRSSSEGDNRVDNIDYDADLITSGISVHDTQYIVAPVMNIDESAVLAGTLNIKDISARYDVSEDDTHAVEFGEYPKTYVDNIVNKKLEELYTSGGLTPTGKAYFCGVGGDSGLTPLYNLEYMTRDNDKYVRVFSRKYDSDSILSDGTELPEEEKPFWVRVEPIEWRIMNWDNLSTMINPNGTGEDDYLELQTQYGIISGIPFYPKNEDESEACVLWQNSTIRGYLNGINVNNIKENGNPDYSAPNGGDFSIYNGGFLGEALGINLPKTAVIEESKEVIKDVVDKKKPKGYGVQVLDHPMTVREQLQFYITNGKSFMLHGPSGVGKTRRIEEADPDFTSITLRNGILPEEVIGKTIYPNNDKTKAGTWVPPAWYVSLLDKCNAEPNKNHVLFIDEITNVKPVEQSLVFHLVLNNMIGPNVGPLPENVVVVAAGNSKEESESAYTMTEPLFRRFDGHVYLKPDVHQFLEWGSEPHPKDSSRPKVHPLVANFVATYGDKVFYSPYDSEEPPKYAIDPRGWEQISDIIYDNHGLIAKELIENKVGTDIASSFIAFASTPQITVEDVIDGTYSDEDIPSSFDAKYAMALSLRGVKEEHISNIRNFIYNELGSEVLSMFDTVWVGDDNERAILIDSLGVEEKVDNEDSTPHKHKYVITVDEFWDAKEKMKIHTDEKWKSDMLREIFDAMGKHWWGGSRYESKDYYSVYGAKTAYTNDGGYWYVGNDTDEYKTFDFYDIDYSKYLTPAHKKKYFNYFIKEVGLKDIDKEIDDDKTIDIESWFLRDEVRYIHCDERWKADELEKIFVRMGKKWSDGQEYAKGLEDPFARYGEDTYYANEGTYTGYPIHGRDYEFENVDFSGVLSPIECTELKFKCKSMADGKKLADGKKIDIESWFLLDEVRYIHCDKEWKADELEKIFKKMGKKWCSGTSYMSRTIVNPYKNYGEKTLYSNDGMYTTIDDEDAKSIYKFDEVDFSKVMDESELLDRIAEMEEKDKKLETKGKTVMDRIKSKLSKEEKDEDGNELPF